MKKKIIFCGGGTGGHVFPLISLSNYFSKKDYETILVTDKRGMKYFEKSFLSSKILDIVPYRKGIINKVFFYLNLTKIFIISFFYIKKEKPNIVFGLGGYVAFPICLSAKLLNIKIVLYEPNIVLGTVNKFFVKYCQKLFVNTKNIINIPKKSSTKCIEVGNILREEILNFKPEKKNYLSQKKTIIVLGGSQGAEIFGNIIPQVILDLTKQYDINIVHQAASYQINEIQNFYNHNKIKNMVFNFSQNIFELISKSDLAISRCGASTLGELEFLGIPFVAIPYPFAKDNHQYQNAVYYEKKGSCWILNQKNLTILSLKEILKRILSNNNDELNLKRENMLKNASENSLIQIEKEIKKLL